MNYKFIREQVLKLLNQYSVAGSQVDSDYNNQMDYLQKIPALTNDAMLEIATTVRRIPSVVRLADLDAEDIGKELRYALPEDFYQFKSGDVVKTDDGKILHTNRYSLYGKNYLVVPKDEVGEYSITYYRYPKLLDEVPADDDELDNTVETHFAIPFYVASFLVSQDDAFLCALFNNKYEDKLSKMIPDISAEIDTVQDVYGFN